MDQCIFDDVNHALIWATEHLRRKSFPKISDIYKQDISCQKLEDKSVRNWSGFRANLPTDSEECMLLAMRVYRTVRSLKADEQQLLMLRYWGDYHSKKYLKEALQIKEVMRQRSQHVRLNYRFSYRQIATIQNINYKKVERELKRIMGELETKMYEKGVLNAPQCVPVSQNEKQNNSKPQWDASCFSPH